MKKCNLLNKRLLILFILVVFVVLLTFLVINIQSVFAAEENIGSVDYSEDDFKNTSIGIMAHPKGCTVNIVRTGTQKYKMKVTSDIQDYGWGAYCEWNWYVDDNQICQKTFNGTAWPLTTYESPEFTHSDTIDFNVHFYWYVSSAFLNGSITTSKKVISAYDKAAPTINLSNSNGTVTNNAIVNKDVTVKASDVGRAGLKEILVSKNSGGYNSYAKDSVTITEDGTYSVYSKDNVGNTSGTLTFTLDKTKPQVASYDSYTNKAFDFKVTDMLDVSIEYRLNSGTIKTVNQKSIHIDLKEENYGCWQFRATDAAGNATGWETINLYKRSNFPNLEQIKNSYNLPTWYTVKLPTKTFFDIAGNYSFATYEYALNFAIAKEWEYRVVNIGGGKWSYVNVGNESVTQIYDNRTILDNAVLKYAKSYISDRKIFDGGSNNYENPTDENGISRPDALISQNVILPEHLEEYISLPKFFIKHSFSFTRPIEGVAGNKSYVKVKWVSDGILAQNGKEIIVPYGVSIKQALDNELSWKQGYYLVTEYDDCGNIEQYMICIDTGNPIVTADILLGNGTTQTITYDLDYVESHRNVMLYISFDMNSFYDAIDDFIFIRIEGRNLSARFVVGDELPILSYENGYWGNYTIEVYDRSLNSLQFNIRIAGELPSVKHTSTTNETRFVLSIVNNDLGNALTSVELFKVTYDGTYLNILQDDLGNSVSTDLFSYTFKNGGKYIIRFTDVFGRTIESDPVFYMKGLPSGTLKGVKENSATNKDVSFEYEKDCEVNLFVLENGQWVSADEVMVLTEKEFYNTISIAASIETSKIYKIFLYKIDDMNLFVEYRFEIDSIPPNIVMKDTDGNLLAADTTTNKNFYVFWEESNLRVYYYRANDPLGSMGESQYFKENVITLYGEYVFTAYDAVGNKTTQRILLDNIVDYEIEGNYQRLDDGSLISKNKLKLTVKERTKQFECFSSNGMNITNGMNIDVDGTYIFTITDMFDNSVEIIIIIDNLPPSPKITTVNGDELDTNVKTNLSFIVSCDEANVEILISYNNTGVYEKYTGNYLENVGTYNFKLIDRMNNTVVFSITIDKTVDYEILGNYIEIAENSYISKNILTFNVKEEIKNYRISSINGNSFILGGKITSEDVYTVIIEDFAGNITTIIIEIDKTPPIAQIIAENGSVYQINSTINKSYRVVCNEDFTEIRFSPDNKNFVLYDGSLIENNTKTYFEIKDRAGNTLYFWMSIDNVVDYEIIGKYNIHNDVIYSRYGVTIEAKENVKLTLLKSENGFTCVLGEKISLEDKYTILLQDDLGNETTLEIVIDYQNPVIELVGTNSANVSNDYVCVNIYDYDIVKYRKKSDKEWIIFVSGQTFIEHDYYTILAIDKAGNEAQVDFIIDKVVEVEPSIELLDENRYITSNISFKFNENMSQIILLKDNKEVGYNGGVIKEVGTYELSITDSVGNNKKFKFIILPTVAREYKLNIPLGYKVIAMLDGATYDALINGQVVLVKDGLYNLEFISDEISFSLELRVETELPTVNIEKHKNKIIINNPNKENITIELYKNGKKIEYSLGNEIKAVGDYSLKIIDEYGNVNEYTFTLKYINTFGIIVIILAVLAVLAIISIFIVTRLKQNVK